MSLLSLLYAALLALLVWAVWWLWRRPPEVTLTRELPGQESTTDLGGRLVLGGAMATLPLREAREVFEREYLLTQINRFGGNISRTAGFVGMERSALHRKLKSLGVVGNNKGADRDDGHDDMNGDGGQFMG